MVTAGGVIPLQTEITKPEVSPVPIWRCKNTECKAWVRDELVSSGPQPGCPLCSGPMIRGMKHLPKLVKKHKAPKKQTAENAWVH
jgi:hypothetical protein